MRPLYLMLLLLSGPSAKAGTIMALEHQDNPVPINTELGTIVELPGAVKTVTPSRWFQIKEIGERTDVRTFQIKPVARAQPESVTFVMSSGKALAFKLTPASGADKFISVESVPKKSRDGRFLNPELLLMKAMLRGESQGYRKEPGRGSVDSPLESLKFELLSVYGGENLTGYVFSVKNKGPEPFNLHLSTLGFGNPNRAVLSQADSYGLKSCPLLQQDKDCTTLLRMVVRGPKEENPSLISTGVGAPPFAKPGLLGGGVHE